MSVAAIDDLLSFLMVALSNGVVLAKEDILEALTAEFQAGRAGIPILKGRLDLSRDLMQKFSGMPLKRAILEDGLRLARHYGRTATLHSEQSAQ